MNNAAATRDLSKCPFVNCYRQQQLFYVSVRARFVTPTYVPWAPADIYLKEVGSKQGTLAKRDQKKIENV